MDIIHLLPDSVANQIAAGEVIQRPASVVKELVENAIDAGATHIDVLVEDAGRTCIQVIDDGKGMSETDARLAFERHATSKILKAEDLFSLRTMGFRGEALPSIAAVAQVRLTSRMEDRELGTQLCIEGSRVISQEACACPVGANFEIRNLFFNVPARRKFLKSNHTELSNIITEFERIALVNSAVTFTLSHNGTPITKLESSNCRQRIAGICGKKVSEQLLPIEVDTTLVNLKGFVGKPEAARKKGVQQFFFVNGRYMRHAYFHKAVLEAYEQLIPTGEQIPYFLYLDVNPAEIDVNIHPTKTEIKFSNEASIWQIILAAVREALGRFNAVPVMDFGGESQMDIPVFNKSDKSHPQAPKPTIDPTYNPFRASQASSPIRSTRSTTQWEKLYESLDHEQTISVPTQSRSEEFELGVSERSSEHFQFKGTYILTAVRSGLMLIDQHRAHVRILYEKYKTQMENHNVSTQGLLFPEAFQLSTSDALLLEKYEEDFRSLGFDISPLGGGSFALNGVPQGLEGINSAKLLAEMVASTRETDQVRNDEIRHQLALTMARKAAIVEGQVLSSSEMVSLVDDLFATQNPNYTPSGKTIIAILSQDQIDKMF